MADNTEVVEPTEQESPSVEDSSVEQEVEITAEKPVKTQDTDVQSPAEDVNWKAAREELRELREENKRLRGEQKPALDGIKNSEVTKPFLTTDDMMQLNFEEFKATQQFPELEYGSENYNRLFDISVAGEYRAALDEYTRSIAMGIKKPLPSAYQIAKQLKREWSDVLGKSNVQKQKEIEVKTQKAVEQREATVEVESRNTPKTTSTEELENLKRRTRQGDTNAIVERLSRSKL